MIRTRNIMPRSHWCVGHLIQFNKPVVAYSPFFSVNEILEDPTIRHWSGYYIFRVSDKGKYYCRFQSVNGKWKCLVPSIRYKRKKKVPNNLIWIK